MTNPDDGGHVRLLLVLAANDEDGLQYMLSDEIFGFHAQQAAEKLLKALLTAHKIAYPKVHSLNRLLDLLASHHELVPDLGFDLLLLDPYAVDFRYDLGAALAAQTRSDIRAAIQRLRSWVLARMESTKAGS